MNKFEQNQNGFLGEKPINNNISLARIENVPFETLERLHSTLRKAGLLINKEHNPKTPIGFLSQRLNALGITTELEEGNALKIIFPTKNNKLSSSVKGTSEQIYKAYLHYENIMKKRK